MMRLIAALFAVLFCSFSSASYGQIKIGVAGPITGPNAEFGQQMKSAAEQAVADINADGGIQGQKLQLVVGDDVSDPKQGVSVANHFASEGVKFVVGHFNSSVSIPASQVYAEAGIIQISPASTNPNFTDNRPGKGVFRVCGRDDEEGSIAASYISAKLKGRNVLVIHDTSNYSANVATQFKGRLLSPGSQVPIRDVSSLQELSSDSSLSRAGSDDNVLFFAGNDVTSFLDFIQKESIHGKLMITSAILSASPDRLRGIPDGTLMTDMRDPRRLSGNAALIGKFKGRGVAPEPLALYTYAAIEVYAQAAQKAGTQFNSVAEAISKGTFYTALGETAFTPGGDVKLPGYDIFTWEKGHEQFLASGTEF